MLGKIELSARYAKEAGITDMLYLCGERAAAYLKLAVSVLAPANGVSYHTP